MKHVLDGRGIRTKSAMLDALAETLDFPDYFGHNLDALNDLVNDMPPGEHTLVWRHRRDLANGDPDAYTQILEILQEANDVKLVLED